MANRKAPKLTDSIGIAVSRVVFGGFKAPTIIGALLFLIILMNLFTDQLSTHLQRWAWLSWVVYGLFAVTIGGLMVLIHRAAEQVRLVISQDGNPPACRVLVIFLSPPGADAAGLASWCADARLRGGIVLPATRALFRGSWRMCVEAVAHHNSRLERLIVIPSRDGDSQDGTWRHLDVFRGLVAWLCARPNLKIASIAELTGVETWREGVDFENAQELVDSMAETYRALNAVGFEDYEIMIDVTGGQKPPSIAGAAVSLEKTGRRFQYVSTRGYLVRAYDITYRPKE